MSEAVRHCIFDLDGTLIDSRAGVELAVELALGSELDPATRRRMTIGPPVPQLMRSVRPSATPDELAALSAAFRRHYDDVGWRRAAPFPGIPSVLSRLNRGGVRLHLVTNKPALPTQMILEVLGLRNEFDTVVNVPTADSPDPKSHALVELVATLEAPRSTMCYIGDTIEDLRAASAATVPFIAVSHGYGIDELRSHPGVRWAHSAEELCTIILGARSPK